MKSMKRLLCEKLSLSSYLQSVALMAQNDIMNVVRELGVNELGIYFYDHSNEPASELNSRMDGILAGVAFGDIVFVQSPSWNVI